MVRKREVENNAKNAHDDLPLLLQRKCHKLCMAIEAAIRKNAVQLINPNKLLCSSPLIYNICLKKANSVPDIVCLTGQQSKKNTPAKFDKSLLRQYIIKKYDISSKTEDDSCRKY
jgi:hypothetical protein